MAWSGRVAVATIALLLGVVGVAGQVSDLMTINAWDLIQPQFPSLGPQLAYHAASQIIDPFDAIYSPAFTTNKSITIHMAVFGGIFSFVSEVNNIWGADANTQLTDDMWLFFVSTRTWKQIARLTGPLPAGTGWPSPRAVHAMHTLIFNSNSVLVLFGGQNGTATFGDTWLWPWTRNATHARYSTYWYNATSSVSPGPRWAFGSTVHLNAVYLIGGARGAQTASNDVWMFSLTSETSGVWRLLFPAYAFGPYPRFLFSFGIFHNATTNSAQMLVTGGWPQVNQQDDSLPMRDMWTAPLLLGNTSAFSLNSSFASNPPLSVHTPSNESSPWRFLGNNGPGMANGKTLSIHFKPNIPTLVSLRGIQYSFASTFSSSLYPIVTDNVYIFDPAALDWYKASLTVVETMSDYPGSTIGQTVINFNQEIVLFGGFNTFVSLLSNRASRVIVSCPDNTSVVWTPFQPQLQPEERQSAMAIVRQELLYVIGGWMRRMNEYSDVWSFDPAMQVWTELPISSVVPVAAASLVEYGGMLYMFGGVFQYDNGTIFLRSELTRIDIDALTSSVLTPVDGISPTPRQLHTAVVNDNSMYVFGGVTCPADEVCSGNYTVQINHSLNELWVYSFPNNTWFNLSHVGAWPTPRNKHSAVVMSTRRGPEMFVYGGISNTVLDDLWAFTFSTQRWRLVTPRPGPTPGPRCWHFASAIGEPRTSQRMQLVDGVTLGPQGVEYFYDAWVYHGDTNTWMQTNIGSPIGEQTTFAAYAYDDHSNTLFVFGGMQYAFEPNRTAALLNDLYVLQPGCNSGYFSPNYSTVPCMPCPIGSFAEGPGQTSCDTCSIGVSTRFVGSSSALDCNTCDSSSCSGKGTCVVDSSGFVSCINCDFGYSGQYCGITTVRDVIISVCILVPAVFLLGWIIKSFFKKNSEARLFRNKYEEASAAVEEAKKVFSIDFGDISIFKEIANGANGSISLARYWGMEVAAKCLTNASLYKELDKDVYEEECKKFSDEGKTLSSLHHANIVRYYGTTIDGDGRPYLVMEYCSRGSLFRIINSPIQLGWPELHQFAYQCCLGMAFLHSRKRIHLDLKSLNLFIAEDWTLKVGDFGNTLNLGIENNNEKGGTIQWMAPERLPGFSGKEEKHEFGACDVYSFGIVMWEIGERAEPYGGRTAADGLVELILGGQRPKLDRVVALPREYCQIMQEAWNQSSSKRPTFKDLEVRLKKLKPVQPAFSVPVLERVNADFGRHDPSQLRQREVALQRQGSVEPRRSNSVSGSYVNVLRPPQRPRPSVSGRFNASVVPAPTQLELLVVNSGSDS